MSKRISLRGDHMAFHELRNYQNTLKNAFNFLGRERIEVLSGDGLKECRNAMEDACVNAMRAGRVYLDMLKQQKIPDDAILAASKDFREATQTVIDQMNMLKKTTHEVEYHDAGTTFTFTYLDVNGVPTTSQSVIRVNSQDVYEGLGNLRNQVPQKQLQADLNRLEDSIGSQYKPRDSAMAVGA